MLFLYINKELSEKKIKKTILFRTALKIIKYLAISLTKCIKNLHAENNKSLIKVIKENINR